MSRAAKLVTCFALAAVVAACLLAAPRVSLGADRYWPSYWQWYDREYVPYHYYYDAPGPSFYGTYGSPGRPYSYYSYPSGTYDSEYRSPSFVGPRIRSQTLPGAVYWY